MSLEKVGKVGNLLTRIVVGLIFILAGYGKLFAQPGIEGFTGMLAGIGVPLAGIMAVVVGIIELVGGIVLLLGLETRVTATLLAIIILVAVLTVHIGQGWGGLRYPLLLLVVLIKYIGGPGWCDVRSCFSKKKT